MRGDEEMIPMKPIDTRVFKKSQKEKEEFMEECVELLKTKQIRRKE